MSQLVLPHFISMQMLTRSSSVLLTLTLMGAGCAGAAPVVSPPVANVTPPTEAVAPVTSDATTTEGVPLSDTASSTSNVTTSSTEVTKPMTLAFPGAKSAAEVNKKIRIKTSKGDIVIQVDGNMGANAAANFVYLVQNGFYDGTIFHRVIPGFMIQGGDPSGTGMGGPGYQFPNDEAKLPYKDGLVAMANAGRDTNGSQFFIMVADAPLPPDYSEFGTVVEGLSVAHAIAAVARDASDRPQEEIKMLSVTIE